MIENTNGKSGIDYIMNFSHSGKKVTDLSRIKALLNALDDPHKRLKFVHIAGTNGKGSMAQMFAEVFISTGLKTGIFTSPYIIEYNDRIRINNKNIPNDGLGELGLTVKKAVESLPMKEDFSQFEITQAIAFSYFASEKCDIVVLETGLGGLLDCTNIVDTSILTVIGSVDFDHTAVLGNTLEKIAAQKAGIIKPDVPCVLSAGNQMPVIKTVRKKAAENLAQLVIPNISQMTLYSCDPFGSEFDYKSRRYRLNMGGAHQVLNAMTVIEGINLIKDQLNISYENTVEGLEKAKVIGRVEVIDKSPLTILDGAHNPDGLSALAGVIKMQEKAPVYAVIGMCRDKSIADSAEKLNGNIDRFITVDGFSERAEDRKELAKIISKACPEAEVLIGEGTIEEEIEKMKRSNPNGLNVICGSLFLVSYVKNNG